jgi:hypothetical protein
MDTETLLRIVEKCDRHIGAINAMQDVNSLDASDHGRLWAYEEMRETLLQYVKNINSELYQTLVQNAYKCYYYYAAAVSTIALAISPVEANKNNSSNSAINNNNSC